MNILLKLTIRKIQEDTIFKIQKITQDKNLIFNDERNRIFICWWAYKLLQPL